MHSAQEDSPTCGYCRSTIATDFELIPYFESRYSKGKDTRIKRGKEYLGALLNHLFLKKDLAYHLMHFCENELTTDDPPAGQPVAIHSEEQSLPCVPQPGTSAALPRVPQPGTLAASPFVLHVPQPGTFAAASSPPSVINCKN